MWTTVPSNFRASFSVSCLTCLVFFWCNMSGRLHTQLASSLPSRVHALNAAQPPATSQLRWWPLEGCAAALNSSWRHDSMLVPKATSQVSMKYDPPTTTLEWSNDFTRWNVRTWEEPCWARILERTKWDFHLLPKAPLAPTEENENRASKCSPNSLRAFSNLQIRNLLRWNVLLSSSIALDGFFFWVYHLLNKCKF